MSEIGMVVIGASAGAIECLSLILPKLPAKTPFAVAIVVHVPPDRDSVMADLFRAKCLVRVKEAEPTEPVEPGTVYFAPPDYHLLIEPNRTLSLSSDEPVLYSRPSIDVLFQTAADAYGPELLGIALTGANSDGANGMRAIREAGGQGIVQDPATAYASAMPKAALVAFPEAAVLPPVGIAAALIE